LGAIRARFRGNCIAESVRATNATWWYTFEETCRCSVGKIAQSYQYPSDEAERNGLPGQTGIQPGVWHSCLLSRSADLFLRLRTLSSELTDERSARKRLIDVKYRDQAMMIDAKRQTEDGRLSKKLADRLIDGKRNNQALNR
jgi:hypothetical protein